MQFDLNIMRFVRIHIFTYVAMENTIWAHYVQLSICPICTHFCSFQLLNRSEPDLET